MVMIKMIVAAVLVPLAASGDSPARIALLTSGDRPMASREASGPWKDNEEIWAAWEEGLKPESFTANWNGHPTGAWDHGWQQKHPGTPGIWRIMTNRINTAYAARHGYDQYSAYFEKCPRNVAWCTKMSALPLLDLKRSDGSNQYDWVLVHDEDVHFVRGGLRIEDWLAGLATAARPGSVDTPLKDLGKSRAANEFHRATAEACLVLAKDVNPFPGINAGTLYFKNTRKAKELLRRMWMWPLENPEMRVYMSEKWAFEQDVLNLGILTDPDFDACVHVVPTSELYSAPESDPRQVGDFMFHNTGGLCGRPHLSHGGARMVAAKKSDCLDELYGVQLQHALANAPDPADTACNARSVFVNPSNVSGDAEAFGLRLTQHCLTPKHAAAQLPPVFMADPKTQAFPVANVSNRVAKPQCLTPTCYARDERDKARAHYTMLMQAKHAQQKASDSAKQPDPPPTLMSGPGNPPRAHQQGQAAGSPPPGSKEAKRAAEHAAVMKGPVLPENVLRFEDLPSTDSHGNPLARHAFVTLITQGGCDQDSFGYTAGAFALIESLQRTGTKLRIVVAMTNAVAESAELAAQFTAVGAEPVMLEIIDHHGSGLNRLVSARHRHRQRPRARGAAAAEDGGGRRRLLERWKGMFSKILLWAPWGALDKIVYLDTDHVVLHNIDHVTTVCAHSGICAVNDPTQNRMWDGNYVNAGMMVLEPNLKDYHGLLDAIANNTLTTGVPGNYDPNAFLARDGKTRKSWITGGKSGSLLEQDLLNVYFSNRTMYLAHGYNIWAKILNQYMVPGAFFDSQALVDKVVKPRVHCIHGNLWSSNDGYNYNFPVQTRELWLSFWQPAARRILDEAQAGSAESCVVRFTKKCVECDRLGEEVLQKQCWMLCAAPEKEIRGKG